jgi:hypothetical protein
MPPFTGRFLYVMLAKKISLFENLLSDTQKPYLNKQEFIDDNFTDWIKTTIHLINKN